MIALSAHRGGRAVRAVVSTWGASLRALTVDGVDLVQPTVTGPGADEAPPLSAGAVLVPWPNRVDGARWTLDGREQRLDVTEPPLGHALHGLLADARYGVVARSDDAVTLAAPIRDRRGYPFELDTRVRYLLTDRGVRVEHRIGNAGRRPAPVAVGAHPYPRVGRHRVADLVLTVPAATAVELDDRYVPTGSRPVAGTDLDLTAGRRVGDAVRHACLTDLRAGGGLVRHTLTSPTGEVVTLWADEAFGWVQVFVTPDFPGAGPGELAVAVEPMTAPPNALRSGVGLRWLAPGETWALAWGIALDA